MASNVKITDLTELALAASGDWLVVVDVATGLTKKLNVDNLPASGGGRTQGSSTGDGTTEISWVTDHGYFLTFGAQNEAITFVDPTVAGAKLVLILKQDSVGSRLVTSWPALMIHPGGIEPTLSTGANQMDIISLYWDGANYHQYGFGADES